MQSVFDSSEWHARVADLVAAGNAQLAADRLIALITATVPNNGTSLMAFHRDASPEVISHSLAARRKRHYLDRYLAGPYLLDPLYQMAMRRDKPTLCRFRDTQPDRFRSSEYYRQYVERTHLVDEMDFFYGATKNSTLVIVCGRTERRFTRQELARLRRIEAIVQAALRRIWEDRGPAAVGGDSSMHERLTRCFENFGEGQLTRRERQITQLLLRGYSSKAVARELGIAPGTVMVHKRNLFLKLGITSQYELFSGFIDALSESG